jgi:hypothetical protein
MGLNALLRIAIGVDCCCCCCCWLLVVGCWLLVVEVVLVGVGSCVVLCWCLWFQDLKRHCETETGWGMLPSLTLHCHYHWFFDNVAY